MLRTITLTTQKGGTGKTTLATSLAVAALEAGEKVVAFDFDPQGSLMEWRNQRSADDIPVEPFPASKLTQLPQITKALEKQGFTLVILDTPGADNTATHKAMEAATLCLVPIRPTRLDANAIRPTVQALMRSEKPFAFVLNQCPPQPNNSRAPVMAEGLSTVGFLAQPMVMTRADYQDAYAHGKGVTEHAPSGKAAEEMRSLWQWIDQQMKSKK